MNQARPRGKFNQSIECVTRTLRRHIKPFQQIHASACQEAISCPQKVVLHMPRGGHQHQTGVAKCPITSISSHPFVEVPARVSWICLHQRTSLQFFSVVSAAASFLSYTKISRGYSMSPLSFSVPCFALPIHYCEQVSNLLLSSSPRFIPFKARARVYSRRMRWATTLQIHGKNHFSVVSSPPCLVVVPPCFVYIFLLQLFFFLYF